MEILRCKVCGKPYKAYISNSKYCSIGCKAKSQTYRIDFQKIVEMYERGMTQTEIANELGTTQKVIYNSFRRNGYKCRKAAKRNQLGKNNNSWVGDNATYATFHKRVESLYGRPIHCEINEWCQKVLRFHFPKSIQYDDITRTDFTPWRGKVDVLTGGFPCQPFSTAGKRRGAEDDRYLWPEMLRAIREIRPAWVIGENVAGITSMVQPGSEVTVESQASLFETSDKETLLEQEYVIETVCRDLEREGYSVQPILIPACGVGAPHRRDRVWFIASYRSDARIEGLRQERKNEIHEFESTSHSDSPRFQAKGTGQQTTGIAGSRLQGLITNAEGKQLENTLRAWRRITGSTNLYRKKDWRNFPTQPPVCGRYDGLPFDVDYLAIPFTKWRQESIKAYGNAIVPQVAFEIFKAIEASIHSS